MATTPVQSGGSTPPAPQSFQQTIGEGVMATGVGLHLGQQTTVRLLPAEPNEGRYFVRTDLDAMSGTAFPRIAATVDRVVHTQLSTELGVG